MDILDSMLLAFLKVSKQTGSNIQSLGRLGPNKVREGLKQQTGLDVKPIIITRERNWRRVESFQGVIVL